LANNVFLTSDQRASEAKTAKANFFPDRSSKREFEWDVRIQIFMRAFGKLYTPEKAVA
jgi:hypothetical protein